MTEQERERCIAAAEAWLATDEPRDKYKLVDLIRSERAEARADLNARWMDATASQTPDEASADLDAHVAEVEQLRAQLAEVTKERDALLEDAGMSCEDPCGTCSGCLYSDDRAREAQAEVDAKAVKP